MDKHLGEIKLNNFNDLNISYNLNNFCQIIHIKEKLVRHEICINEINNTNPCAKYVCVKLCMRVEARS